LEEGRINFREKEIAKFDTSKFVDIVLSLQGVLD
jgi:hypothetical protein